MDWVETDGIDSEDVGGVAVVGGLLAVAFEREVVVLVLVLDVLNRAAPFYRADGIPSGIGEGTDNAGLPLER